jgi:DNA-binding response OmpR family regulator
MNKVLVIDPDEGIRGSLKTFLNQLEYTVILANSGKQGISLFEKEEPDLVITPKKRNRIKF